MGSKKQKKNNGFTVGRLAKTGLVAALWAGIALTLLVAWYAADLPRIASSPHFERKASITFKADDGSTIDRYGELTGLSVSIDDLPPHLVQAVLATEDRRFYDHFGLDPVGLARAMVSNLKAGRVVQGGSTITQQLAKNLFLNRERTFKRKIQEAILALWLEQNLTKDEILSAYFNRVYLGSGAYGVDAAAQVYFGKSAREVNLREAAILAGLLKAPSRYSPASNPGLSSQRAKVVLGAMADAGYITKEEAENEALSMPMPARKPAESGGVHYFTDWVAAELSDLVGATDIDLVVETTLDPRLQKAAEMALAKALRENAEAVNVSQGAIIVMDYDGAVLAMVGGRDYEASQFNRATQALRPPGSSFKPVVYLTALEAGWRKTDLIEDSPLRIGRYRPQNYGNEYLGMVPMELALAKSLNTAAVRLAQQVGINNVHATARRLGIRTKLEHDLSVALGSSGVPMLEMVGAYTVIANGGHSVHPYAVRRITDSGGRLVYQRTNLRPGKPLFSPKALDDLDDMLQGVVEYGTGQRARLGTRAAGKTGTSQDHRDAWFIGYTDCCVAAVWMGNDDNSSMKNLTGGNLPAGVWRDVMVNAPRRERDRPQIIEPIAREVENFGSFLERLFND